jgi:hypothetical protein
MPRPSPLPEKVRWLVLVAGLTASIPLYAVVAFVVAAEDHPGGPAPMGLRFAFYGASLGLALLALVLAPRVGNDAAAAPPFATLLRRTILSLAVAEGAAILGLVLFLLGRDLGDFLVLGGLALAVILLGIVPRGLRWFRLREETTPGGPPISPG